MADLITSSLIVFGLRVLDITFYTLRIRLVMRGRKGLAWVFGFFQAGLYVGALSLVFSNLENTLKILGYAAGFATGLVLGMNLEDRLAIGYTHLRILSQNRGAAIVEGLRQAAYGVTEVPAHGMNGTVSILHCSILRKNEKTVTELISKLDPQAFITAENVLQVQRGFWHY